jgi:2-keto-3-deoxy-6-phosphogluconate aldolase
MGIVMQLLIDQCEFPNNTSPRELLARKETSAEHLIAAGTVVNRAATSPLTETGAFS